MLRPGCLFGIGVALILTMVWGCEDGDTTTHDSSSGTESISAAKVEANPVDPIHAQNVQAWLEELLQLLSDHATTLAQLDSTVENHDERIGILESRNPTANPPTAADVAFDDSGTTIKGPTVQLFGGAMDTQVAQLTSAVNLVTKDHKTTQQQVADLGDELTATQEELAEVAFNASAVVGAYDVLVETSTTPKSAGLALPEAYPYNNTVHGAFQETWEYLEPLIQLTSKPCPDEMVLVHDMVCVDKKQWTDGTLSKLSWKGAAFNCMNVGKRLCSPNEFFAYCVFPADHFEPSEYSALDTLKNTEWMDQLSGPGFMAFAGSGKGCKDIAPVAADTFLHFRCCKTPTPITGAD